MSGERDAILQLGRIETGRPVLLPSLRNGVDLYARLVNVDKVEMTLKDSPNMVSSIFTLEEVAHSLKYKARPQEHFAARLGAKQVILELLGSNAIGWQDVWIRNNDYNSPSFVFSDVAQGPLNKKGIEAVHVSLSHEDAIAVAFCAVERGDYTLPTSIVRIGTDICSVRPFRTSLVRKTTFSEEEMETARQQEDPAQRQAMYYAAKESVIKILEKLAGWIWQEIEVHEGDKGTFQIALSGSARERLDEMGAVEIVTSLSYQEDIGALAFSAALTHPLDRIRTW